MTDGMMVAMRCAADEGLAIWPDRFAPPLFTSSLERERENALACQADGVKTKIEASWN